MCTERMLSEKIVTFFIEYFQRSLLNFELEAIEYCLDAHEIDRQGDWMINLFGDLLGKRLDKRIELINPSYPNGDMGFTNLMLDLKVDFNFDLGNFDEQGEYINWDLESLNLSFFLCREGLPDFYIIEKIAN